MKGFYCGFDVSKLTIDYAFLKEDGNWITRKIDYQEKELNKLLGLLSPGACCVMEATGPYYLRLANFLYQHGYRVSVVNPLVIKRYSQMKLRRTKTDKADARLICEYGHEQHPETWEPKSKPIRQIKDKLSTQEFFIKQKTMLYNKLESLSQEEGADEGCKRMVKQEISNISRKIDKLSEEIEVLVNTSYKQQYRLLLTIPGVGSKTAATLIAVTNGFTLFESHKKLASYIGLCPRIFQSGTSVNGKAAICKMGMSRMRQLLYLAAVSAHKHNRPCNELYVRLIQKGKAKKLALIAVANKLLRQAFGIIKNNLPYYEFA